MFFLQVFGETVLGLSQGSVSELLSKPKPWHMLSIKGREPFIRMQLWLNDPMNLERLKSGSGGSFPTTPSSVAEQLLRRDMAASAGSAKRRFGLDSSSDRSSPVVMEDDSGSNQGGADSPMAKKMRQTHASGGGEEQQQREALMIAFALDPVPQQSTVEFLAAELGVDQSAISGWYSSHKLRLKQLHGIKPESLFPPAGGDESQQGIDPTKFRILMAHRRMELQAGAVNPAAAAFPFPINPALFGLPGGLGGPGGLPASRPDIPRSGSDSGLDLRFPRMADSSSEMMSGSIQDGGDVSDGTSDKEDEGSEDSAQKTSRRKGSAPQWVKPDWSEGGDGNANDDDLKKTDEPINGVCVRNIPEPAVTS